METSLPHLPMQWRRLHVAIVTLLSLLLTSCGSAPDEVSLKPPPKVEIIGEVRTEYRIVRSEEIDQNNCGGKAETGNTVTRLRTVERSFEWGSEVTVDAGGQLMLFGTGVDVGTSVAAHLGYTYGSSESLERSLEVKSPPGDHMVHRVNQREVWDVGLAQIEVQGQTQSVPFSFRRDFDLQLELSFDMGCDGVERSMPTRVPTPTSILPTETSIPPQPTDTPVPPTVTPIPTDTPTAKPPATSTALPTNTAIPQATMTGKSVTGAKPVGSVAVLLPDRASSARWESDDRRFLQAAFIAAGVDFTIVNAEGDSAVQQTQAEQALTNGAKVLLLVYLDSGSGAAIIAKAREAGAKVIDYDRLTIEGDGADFYVSVDMEAVGRLQGEGLVKACTTKNAQVAVLNGSPTDKSATLFANGYNSVIKKKFDSKEWTKVADQSVPDWDNQKALVMFEQMLTAAGGKIDCAIAANDGLAQAVIAALENQGLNPIPVTGQDATVGGIQNVLAGKQSMTVYKSPKAEAEAAATLAIALLKGEDTSKMASGKVNNGKKDVPAVLLVPVSVTKENVKETVIADGFRNWSEICNGDFAQFCPADR